MTEIPRKNEDYFIIKLVGSSRQDRKGRSHMAAKGGRSNHYIISETTLSTLNRYRVMVAYLQPILDFRPKRLCQRRRTSAIPPNCTALESL